MPLSQEQRDEIIINLVANEDTHAAQAWSGVELSEATDEQLLAFNEAVEFFAPMEGVTQCPCGRQMAWNQATQRWEHTGAPKAGKTPASISELLANGGGTAEDREVYAWAVNHIQARKNELLEQLTANMSDAEREATWEDYKTASITDLEKLVKRFGGATQTQPQQPVSNFFGAQGAPAGPVNNNMPTLSVPTLEFKRRNAV